MYPNALEAHCTVFRDLTSLCMLQCAAPTKWTASLIHMAREPLFSRELVFIYNDDVHIRTYALVHVQYMGSCHGQTHFPPCGPGTTV